jgi:hypothetical protein
VWVGSWYGLRTLTRQPDGTYRIDTVATPDHSRTQGLTWSAGDTSVVAANVYDVQPLPDGRVLLVAGDQMWQLGRDGVLRPGAAGRYRSLAASTDRLYTVGPIGHTSAGALRVSRLP